MQSFMKCVCCVQNIHNLLTFLIVEGIFQDAFLMALWNKCDLIINADVLFEEDIMQKIDGHLIHFCK
jgi:hypothetical protein